MVFTPAPERLIGGKYRLVRRLAVGGMGAVWLAHHETLDAAVAVKIMSPTLAETLAGASRFKREAKASAQLRSPHIVKVQDYGVEDGAPFMVMELLVGEDLGSRIEKMKRLPLEDVVRIAGQVGKALGVAHAAGIVHRDLKPSNVFLAREGGDEVVKLLDFGIARETREALVDERTGSGVVLGSPYHMSPEQARGEAVDPRSDLWSLGVVIYRTLTGKRPFDGESVPAVLLSVVSDTVTPASSLRPELPAAIDRFFDRAFARQLDERFENVRAMCEALSAIAGGRDATPWLEAPHPPEPSVEGRAEPTLTASVPSHDGVPSQEGRSASELTGSRAIEAVTTGLRSIGGRRRGLRRALPWIAAIAAVGTASFLVGRAWTTSDATPPAASAVATTPVAPTAATDAPSRVTSTDAPSPVSAPAPAASSARRVVTPAPRAHVPPPTPAPKARIDPFTGLPIGK